MKGPTRATGVGGTLSTHGGRDGRRKVAGRSLDQRRPDVPHGEHAAPEVGAEQAYCSTCHAIYHRKHWHLDEARYLALRQDPACKELTCPGCHAIAHENFGGRLEVSLTGLERHRDQILATLRNEEARARQVNPHERIGRLEDTGTALWIDTLSPFLAHRMAGVLKKTFHGTRAHEHLDPNTPRTRVRWGLPAAEDTPQPGA